MDPIIGKVDVDVEVLSALLNLPKHMKFVSLKETSQNRFRLEVSVKPNVGATNDLQTESLNNSLDKMAREALLRARYGHV